MSKETKSLEATERLKHEHSVSCYTAYRDHVHVCVARTCIAGLVHDLSGEDEM